METMENEKGGFSAELQLFLCLHQSTPLLAGEEDDGTFTVHRNKPDAQRQFKTQTADLSSKQRRKMTAWQHIEEQASQVDFLPAASPFIWAL